MNQSKLNSLPRWAWTSLAALILCVCCVNSALLSQSRDNSATQAVPERTAREGQYRIAGILVNSITGEPVRRATVAVLAESNSRTIASVGSDSEGRFSLERLPAASYQLTASKRGFRTGFFDEHDEFSSAIVTGADQDTTHLVFRLTPNAVLRGVVSGDGGDPVDGARVLLFQRPQHHDPGERTTQVDATVTDDTGAYEFSNLAAGEYLLAVVAEPWYAQHGSENGPQATKANTELDVAYPVTYFDSTNDEAAAAPIVLTAGSRAEANVNLHAVPALHLSIATPRKQDGSIARAELQKTVFGTVVTAESAGFIDSMRTGKVEMNGIAPGRYQLVQGDPPRVVDLDLLASLQVDPNVGSPAAVVTGTLQLDSGLAAPDEVNLTFDRLDNVPGPGQLVAVAHKGRFKFDNVTPGSWTLWAVSGDKALSVVATTTGRAQRAGNIVTVRDQPLNLVVTVSQGATRVEGFATKAGKSVAGAMVVLLPKDTGAWQSLARRDQSNSDGSFALRDVAPGQYTLVAIQDGWSLDWWRPELMGRYLPGGTAVTVTGKSGSLMRLPATVAVQMR